MIANPFLGILLHALGGLAAGSFYLPFKKVRKWAWESYWLVGGLFSWIIAPWVVGYVEELCAFPRGSHDDQVDATSQAMIKIEAMAGWHVGVAAG